jgi:hypothetical protein
MDELYENALSVQRLRSRKGHCIRRPFSTRRDDGLETSGELKGKSRKTGRLGAVEPLLRQPSHET